jgi:site-specific DNA-methyltransferase (adenine-specific)
MNSRKLAFQRGLGVLARIERGGTVTRAARVDRLSATPDKNGRARPRDYNARSMPAVNQIIHGDCIEVLKQYEGQVDLVFADPPFNIGYLYHNYDDEKDVTEYVEWSEQWMRAVHAALKPSGSFYLAIGDEFAADLCHAARRKIGFHLRNWIIWHYTFGQQTKKMFAKSHTHILYFTKSKSDFTFNPDEVRVASARQTTYADKRANAKGKLPDDTWFLRPQEAAPHGYFESGGDTWYESRVCGTFKEREGWHGCQMPIGVLNRIIKASSNAGDLVLDPFNGSGTTAVSAALLDRNYVGIDQSEEYVSYAQKRLNHALAAKAANNSANGNGVAPISIATIADPRRASKVLTATDAFGRPRVPRRRAAKSA